MADVDARGRTVVDEGTVDHPEQGSVFSLRGVRCDDAAGGMDSGGSGKRKIRVDHADVLKNGIRCGAMADVRRHANDRSFVEGDRLIREPQLSAGLCVAQKLLERMTVQREGRHAAFGFEYAQIARRFTVFHRLR